MPSRSGRKFFNDRGRDLDYRATGTWTFPALTPIIRQALALLPYHHLSPIIGQPLQEICDVVDYTISGCSPRPTAKFFLSRMRSSSATSTTLKRRAFFCFFSLTTVRFHFKNLQYRAFHCSKNLAIFSRLPLHERQVQRSVRRRHSEAVETVLRRNVDRFLGALGRTHAFSGRISCKSFRTPLWTNLMKHSVR